MSQAELLISQMLNRRTKVSYELNVLHRKYSIFLRRNSNCDAWRHRFISLVDQPLRLLRYLLRRRVVQLRVHRSIIINVAVRVSLRCWDHHALSARNPLWMRWMSVRFPVFHEQVGHSCQFLPCHSKYYQLQDVWLISFLAYIRRQSCVRVISNP